MDGNCGENRSFLVNCFAGVAGATYMNPQKGSNVFHTRYLRLCQEFAFYFFTPYIFGI